MSSELKLLATFDDHFHVIKEFGFNPNVSNISSCKQRIYNLMKQLGEEMGNN